MSHPVSPICLNLILVRYLLEMGTMPTHLVTLDDQQAVAEAMRRLDRAHFVPPLWRSQAWRDRPLPLEALDATISVQKKKREKRS